METTFARITEFRAGRLTYGDGIVATVETPEFRFYVSRYADEAEWIVDGLWKRANSFPIFHNGAGSRCTRLTAVSDPTIVAMLDAQEIFP